ncbi:hypothetical protein BKA69DRAFT_3655 [Paraphysoderma sedebokerense]|nr:hypothetical protein BKA69DRAFT_3655 [Paraphysoderma sedebokerense]
MANYIPTVIAVSVMIFVGLLLVLLQRFGVYKISFTTMNILINFLQTIWILRNMRLDWPQDLLEVLQHINFFAINIEIVAPECVIQAPLSFSQKLRIVFALPICLLGLSILIASMTSFITTMRKSRADCRKGTLPLDPRQRERAAVTDIAFSALGIFHIALSILYVNIVAKSFALFDCTLEDDGRAWLDEEVSLVCYTDWWYQDLPYSILAVVFYALGIPLYFGVLSYFYYQKHHDGPFWEKWRRISERLLEEFSDGHFKREYQYYIVVQLLQKLAMRNPFINPTLNSLEKLSVMCSIVVLALGLPFKIDNFRISQYRSGLIAAIVSVILGFILAVLGAGLNDIRRNFRTIRRAKAEIDQAFN